MTFLLYRLDDKVTVLYDEYLSEKDKCEIAYPFYLEGMEDMDAKAPGTYSEIKGKIKIPTSYI